MALFILMNILLVYAALKSLGLMKCCLYAYSRSMTKLQESYAYVVWQLDGVS